MSDTEPIRIDDARWDRIVELVGNSANVCYQCGVCTAICPWGLFGAEGPNVRLLMRNAQLGLDDDKATEEALWLCTTCGACEEFCPRAVPVTDVIVGLRSLAFEERRAPERLEGVLWSLYENGNPDGFPPSGRMAWAADLDLPPASPSSDCMVYFGSAACYDPRLQRIGRAFRRVLQAAQVNFGVLEDEPDSGDVVRLVGEQGYLEECIQANLKTFEASGVREIVTLSPHDYDIFKRIYPAHGGAFRVFHATEYLAQLVAHEALAFAEEKPQRALYHDPCYLGRHHDIYDAPRQVLGAMPGLELVEFADSRESALCCGGGGARMWLETKAGERFSDLRVQEAKERGIDLIITSCPYCIQMFEDSVRSLRFEGIEVRDVVETAGTWGPHVPRQPPNIYETCDFE